MSLNHISRALRSPHGTLPLVAVAPFQRPKHLPTHVLDKPMVSEKSPFNDDIARRPGVVAATES